MNSYTIYTPISSIMRGFACFECFCRIQVYKPKSQDQKIFFGPNQVIKDCQRSLIGRRHVNPRQNPWIKRCTKTHRSKEARLPWPEASTGRGGYHGRGSPSFPRLLRLLRCSLFSHAIFSFLCCYVAFEKIMYLATKRDLFHSSTILHHLVLVLVYMREKEGEAKIARMPCRVQD